MGIVSRAQSGARRVATGKARKKGRRAVTTQITTSNETEDFLKKFPIELRLKVLTKAVRAGQGPVKSAARAKIASEHRSEQTGTRDRWSASVKAKREGNKPLFQTLFVKVTTPGHAALAMLGGRWPEGAHWHLLEFGTVKQRPYPTLRPAADETKTKQQQALIKKIEKEWQKV